MDTPLSKRVRVVFPNECFPRRSYFQKRIHSIVERMERTLDYEFKSQSMMLLRQDEQDRQKIQRMNVIVKESLPEINIVGDYKLIDDEFTAQLVVRRECMTPVKQNPLTPEEESLCAVCVVVVEYYVDIQTFKTNLEDCLDIVMKWSSPTDFPDKTSKTSKTLNSGHWLHQVVIAVRPDHHVAKATLEDLHDTVQKVLRTFSRNIHFDAHKQIVLLPYHMSHSPTGSGRPLSSGETVANQRTESASGSVHDTHRSSSLVSIHPNPSDESISTHGSQPSSYTRVSSTTAELVPPLPPHKNTSPSPQSSSSSTSNTLQPVLEAIQIETVNTNIVVTERIMTSSMTNTYQHVPQHTRADEHEDVESQTTKPKTVLKTLKNAPCEWTLYQAVSYQFETKLIDDIVVAIETLLAAVKSRRDIKAGKSLFTVLDKLLFEVRGLYNQSITRTATEKKTKADTQRMSTDLANKLLELDHVRGCGHIYGKFSIHIDDGVDEETKVKVMEQIQKVIEHNSALRGPHDYEIHTVLGQPTVFGHKVI